ncbi:MAG: hypothetical protein K8R46_01665 [Pirellulales bacterium]|nr:hypothetical protein [Pirellulales bacterium]
MFSAGVFLAKHVFRPKNGPVPSQPMNGYVDADLKRLQPSGKPGHGDQAFGRD